MPIALTCPKCSGKLRVADNFTAKNVKCPKCSAIFPFSQPEIPAAATTKTAPPAPARGRPSAPDSDDELEEVEELEEVVEDVEEAPRPRRRRNIRRDRDDGAISTIIPYKNGSALAAYYCGIFAFIPVLGLILAPTAAVLGLRGLLYVRANPTAKGTGHAIAGILLCFLAGLVQIVFLALGYIMLIMK